VDLGTVTASIVVLLASALWYGLQVRALRDLRRRPRVRGDNKALWALAILCLPYLGALAYLISGPTSFLPREQQPNVRRPRPQHFPAVPTLQAAIPDTEVEPPDPFVKSPLAGGTPSVTGRSDSIVSFPYATHPQPKTTPRVVSRPKVTPSTAIFPPYADPADWDGVTRLPPLPVFPGEEDLSPESQAQSHSA
jgi:hypothetical protein